MKMEITVCNPQKGRLETIKAEFTEDTTTWFDGTGCPESVGMITDVDGDLLITRQGSGYYPVLIYDITRQDIDHSRKKAGKLFNQALL